MPHPAAAVHGAPHPRSAGPPDWVDHASFGYCLGRRAIGLGGGDNGHAQIRAAAAPLLHELHMQTGMVVHLAVLDGARVCTWTRWADGWPASLPPRVGGRAPAYSDRGRQGDAGVGGPGAGRQLYGPRLNRSTDRTITELSTLHQELNRIRQRRGLAFERGRGGARNRLRRCRGPQLRRAGGRHLAVRRRAHRPARTGRPAGRRRRPGSRPGRSTPKPGTPRRGRRTAAMPDSSWSTETLDQLLAVSPGNGCSARAR